jgi:DNA gyrase subunit A
MKNNYKYKKENYNFWVSRLKKKENLVCTNDILLDRIEENQIINRIENNKTILELGCGNGLILKRLIKNKKIKKYYGTDFVKELIYCTTHDYLMFFTDKGRIYWLKAYNIPAAERYSKGRSLANILNLKEENINLRLIPVSYQDYLDACEGELSSRVIKALVKYS